MSAIFKKIFSKFVSKNGNYSGAFIDVRHDWRMAVLSGIGLLLVVIFIASMYTIGVSKNSDYENLGRIGNTASLNKGALSEVIAQYEKERALFEDAKTVTIEVADPSR